MAARAPKGSSRAISTRVIFDDVLLTNRRLVEFIANRHRLEGAGEIALVDFDPARTLTTFGSGERGGDVADLAAGLADFDLVVRLDAEARDVDALAVHQNVIVANQLTTLRAARGEPDAQDHVVQAALDQAEHLFTGA